MAGAGSRRGRTPPIPYDAEVEWLESDGTQWIDTGIVVDDDLYSLTCDFCAVLNPLASNGQFFGTPLADGGTKYTAVAPYFTYNSIVCPVYGCRGSQAYAYQLGKSLSKTLYDRLEWTLTDGHFTIRDPISGTVLADEASRTDKVAYNPNSVLLGAAGARIWGFEASHDGKALMSLVPVRVGGEGAMYDTLTGTLFRNAGTGSLKAGPDL